MVQCGSGKFGSDIEVGEGENPQPGPLVSSGTLVAGNLGLTDSPLSR